MNSFWDYFQAIVIIGAVLYAAYYVTKLVAKTGSGSFRKSSGIKLIGSQVLGKDKSVAIVEVGAYAYILGVAAQRVELIDKLSSLELSVKNEERATASALPSFTASFKEELSKRFNKWSNKN